MKKIGKKGFVLAETLVVTVFLMVIFSMLYSNFYPLIGEYEKRETYDDVDGKYAVYWIKKLAEDVSYRPSAAALNSLDRLGFMRFECKDMSTDDDKRKTCQLLVKELEAANCDASGNGCDIFITRYRIGGISPDFKRTVETGSQFDSAMKDYVATLPDYSAASLTHAQYRVIAAFKHKRDYNNYNSYATIEVNR